MSENTGHFKNSMVALEQTLRAAADQAAEIAAQTSVSIPDGEPFIVTGLTVFVLACFVGYYVVWRVTPALHSPLMGITNAISSVIIVGAVLAAGTQSDSIFSTVLGFLAVVFASVNIFGGFIITQRMLHMFKKK
ncbi:MAG: proton-translocating transhydrogenase family protein [Alphaproteobacteria bacterium]